MYEYTDRDGDHMSVEKSKDGHGDVFIVAHNDTNAHAVAVRVEDAPAVALAILEAAGNVDINSLEATNRLREFVNLQNAQAEREAEDAKVRAWWDETRYGHTTSLAWCHMGESAHEDVRKQYYLARKFFQES